MISLPALHRARIRATARQDLHLIAHTRRLSNLLQMPDELEVGNERRVEDLDGDPRTEPRDGAVIRRAGKVHDKLRINRYRLAGSIPRIIAWSK